MFSWATYRDFIEHPAVSGERRRVAATAGYFSFQFAERP